MQHERGMTVLQVVSNIVARRSYAMQQSCRATKQGSPIVALLMLGWRSQAHIDLASGGCIVEEQCVRRDGETIYGGLARTVFAGPALYRGPIFRCAATATASTRNFQ